MDIFYYPRLLFYKHASVGIDSLKYAFLKGDKELIQAIVNNPKFDIHQCTDYAEWYANSRFDVNKKDFYPIHFAAICGNVYALNKLMERGADVEQKDAHEMTPLHCSAFSPNLQVTQALIEAGADIEAKAYIKEKNDSSSLLPYMTFKSNINAVEYLKEANLGSKKFTPLAAAACAGNIEVMKVLIKAGANLFDDSVLRAKIESREAIILINSMHVIENIVGKMSKKEPLSGGYKTVVENLSDFESRILKERIIKKFPLAGAEDLDISSIHNLSDQELDFKFYNVITQIKCSYATKLVILRSSTLDLFSEKLVSHEDPETSSVLEAISRLGAGAMGAIHASSSILVSHVANATSKEAVEPVLTPEQQEQVDALTGCEEHQDNDALMGDGAIVCAVQ